MTITQPHGKVARQSATELTNQDIAARLDGDPSFRNAPYPFKHKLVFDQPRRSVSLDTVLKFRNISIVVKIMKDHKLSEKEAFELFIDTLKFLWLSAENGGCVPPPQVDKGWHSFILFHLEYEQFCRQFFGRFLYHRPHHVGDKPDGDAALNYTKQLVTDVLKLPLSGNWEYKDDENLENWCKERNCGYCKCGENPA